MSYGCDKSFKREADYKPSGSKREAVRRAEQRVSRCVAKFLNNLNLAAQKGKPVNVKNASLCMMADGVMQFIYNEDFGTLDAENFESDLISTVGDFVSNMQWPSYFPSFFVALYKIIMILPAWVLQSLFKAVVRPREYLRVSFPFFMT